MTRVLQDNWTPPSLNHSRFLNFLHKGSVSANRKKAHCPLLLACTASGSPGANVAATVKMADTECRASMAARPPMLANGPNYKEKYLKKPKVVSVTFGCFYQADFCSYPHILSSGLVSLFVDQVGGSLIFWLHPLIIRLQVTSPAQDGVARIRMF